MYDIALAPNIEIEVPIGRQWSLNAEYKCPWWSDSNKEICYQLLSGGIESRFWLGNRAGRQLTDILSGYTLKGHLRLQYKGTVIKGKYYGAAGFSYELFPPVSRHLAFNSVWASDI